MSGWGCTLENLSASWEKDEGKILQRVSFDLDGATHTALPLMGLSGAGKSTLLYLLAALKWPYSGRVEWRFPDQYHVAWGVDGLTSWEADKLRRQYFGFAFQDSTLVPHLKIIENLVYPLVFLGEPWDVAQEKARRALRRVLQGGERLQEEELLERFPHQLSGGQRQRAALAQALIHDPTVVFADEPAGNLDLATRQIVMDVLRRWLDEKPQERLLLWVTHHSDDPELMRAQQILWVERLKVSPWGLEKLALWDEDLRKGGDL